MDIFKETKALGPPKGIYVVVGAGVLVALGLLDWDDDIDLAVTAELFDQFKRQGWQQRRWQDKLVLKQGLFDAGTKFGNWELDELLEDALWIRDVPFISLVKLRQWKTEIGRDKDKRHIKLIDHYLENAA